jgi:hypothetical protein
MTPIDQNISAIRELCLQHHVKCLYAFGSVLNENYNAESDVDLLVDFNTIDINQYADNYFNLKFSLQVLLHRPIDLLEERAIQNPYLKESIFSKRRLVYGV